MFYETSSRDVSFFAFSELEGIEGFVHAFSSRKTDFQITDAAANPEVARQKPAFLSALGLSPDRVIALRQIHSNRIVNIAEAGESTLAGGHREGADGILLDRSGAWGVVRSADCVPILLVAPEQKQACLIHAGWRGTCGRIARAGAILLAESSLARPQEIVAAIGPAIRRCCYEVGFEVRDQFAHARHDLKELFHDGHLDLAKATVAQLQSAGVQTILDCGLCTSCRRDLFYSWRKNRDGGRMWFVAGFE